MNTQYEYWDWMTLWSVTHCWLTASGLTNHPSDSCLWYAWLHISSSRWFLWASGHIFLDSARSSSSFFFKNYFNHCWIALSEAGSFSILTPVTILHFDNGLCCEKPKYGHCYLLKSLPFWGLMSHFLPNITPKHHQDSVLPTRGAFENRQLNEWDLQWGRRNQS